MCILTIFFRYIYTDKAVITLEYVLYILYAAKKYFLDSLAKECREFLKDNVTPENVCTFYEQCLFLDEKDLVAKCRRVIEEHTHRAFKSDSFLEISRKTLQNLLTNDLLNLHEFQIFRFCLKWAKTKLIRTGKPCDGTECRAVLGDVLHQIRFPTMSVEDFIDDVIPSKIFTEYEERNIREYLEMADKPRTATALGFSTKPRAAQMRRDFGRLVVMACQR